NVLTIGTLGCRHNGVVVRDDGLTTPGECELRRTLHDYRNDFDIMVIEASSHALEQNRLSGITFDVAGWTNLTQDHLDYHGTMEKYFESKAKLVSLLKTGGNLFVCSKEVYNNLQNKFPNVKKVDSYQGDNVPSELSSPFMRENLALALEIANEIGLDKREVHLLKAPPGRFEIVERG